MKTTTLTQPSSSQKTAARWRTAALCAALWVGLPVIASEQAAPDFQGQGESADRKTAHFVLSSTRPLWPNALINYFYNPLNQPAGISTADMETLLQTAARKWENVCNVRFSYKGITTARPDLDATFETTDRRNVVGWELLTGNQAQFAGYVSWWYQNQGNILIDADMVLNTSQGSQFARNKNDLGALLTHEMGHMLAINHSDKQQSVMFAEPYNTLAFQATLRGDDTAACISLYGATPKADANRVLNWAEQSFSPFLSPVGSASLDLEGYHYRFYPSTNSYIAERDGQVYYLPAGGAVTPLGTVMQFLPLATNAGF